MEDKRNKSKLIRKKPIKTRQGLVFTTKDYKHWQIRYPSDDDYRYGGATSERVAIFFLLLGMGHTLNDADEIAFRKTRTRGKYKI